MGRRSGHSQARDPSPETGSSVDEGSGDDTLPGFHYGGSRRKETEREQVEGVRVGRRRIRSGTVSTIESQGPRVSSPRSLSRPSRGL